MDVVRKPDPPTKLSRVLWRLPVQLYRVHLGRLLGGRFMLLTHTGRVSGRPRKAVVEVIEHGDGGYVAASGFGARSDWYRNLLANPAATVQVRGRTLSVTAVPLEAREGERLMARYAAEHPTAAKRLCSLMGFAVDGSDADFRAVGREIPFVRFVPR